MKLYVVAASHPCETVRKALSLKGMEWEETVLPIGLSAPFQLARFGKRTVPGLEVDGEKVVGSRLILRALDGLVADPPLLPADPDRRLAVLAAERWGDHVLQETARWVPLRAAIQRPEVAWDYVAPQGTPVPKPVFLRLTPMNIRAEMAALRISDADVDAWLDDLPGCLDRVDGWLADGTLGGPAEPTAADLQIGPSIALLRSLEDLRPLIEGRPCEALATELFAGYPPARAPAGIVRVPAGAAA